MKRHGDSTPNLLRFVYGDTERAMNQLYVQENSVAFARAVSASAFVGTTPAPQLRCAKSWAGVSPPVQENPEELAGQPATPWSGVQVTPFRGKRGETAVIAVAGGHIAATAPFVPLGCL